MGYHRGRGGVIGQEDHTLSDIRAGRLDVPGEQVPRHERDLGHRPRRDVRSQDPRALLPRYKDVRETSSHEP